MKIKTKMRKGIRGISPVIATILLILITVAAVGIIWAALQPMIKNQLTQATACSDAQQALEIVVDDGNTCVSSTNGTKVKIKRSPASVELADIQISVTGASGGSKGYYVMDTTSRVDVPSGTTVEIPGENEATVYTIAAAIDGKRVSIAPILKVGNIKQACSAKIEETLPACIVSSP